MLAENLLIEEDLFFFNISAKYIASLFFNRIYDLIARIWFLKITLKKFFKISIEIN